MKDRKIPSDAPKGSRWVYCTYYKHARTGKIMKAADYGRKAWRFLVPERRR